MTDQLINNYKNYAETGLIIDTNGSIENAESTKGTLASKLGVGIDNISYNAEDGVFFVKSGGGVSIDALSQKLQTEVWNDPDLQTILGDDTKYVKAELIANAADGKEAQVTLTELHKNDKVTSKTGSISDFDIRELMKLLIAAFSELRSADRERALNVLTATVAALETKISQLETAKEEQYKAAMANAIGSIVSGALSIGMTIIGSGLSIAGPRKKSGTDASFETKNATKGDIKNSDLLDVSGIKPDTSNISKTSSKTSDPRDDSDIKLNPQKADKSEITDAGDVTIQSTNKNESAHPAYSIIGDAFSRSAQGVGQITTGISGILSAIYSANKTEADIEVTKADALLEILKQAQEQYTKGTDSLQQFIDKVLNVMQQLLQSASQTERSIANI